MQNSRHAAEQPHCLRHDMLESDVPHRHSPVPPLTMIKKSLPVPRFFRWHKRIGWRTAKMWGSGHLAETSPHRFRNASELQSRHSDTGHREQRTGNDYHASTAPDLALSRGPALLSRVVTRGERRNGSESQEVAGPDRSGAVGDPGGARAPGIRTARRHRPSSRSQRQTALTNAVTDAPSAPGAGPGSRRGPVP